jgi:hypothetical protein
MKRTVHLFPQQFNLSLVSEPAITVPQDKQRELKLALVELLTKAACPNHEMPDNGGEDEYEING